MTDTKLTCPSCSKEFSARVSAYRALTCPRCGQPVPTPPPPPLYTVGVDLGQAADYTAIALLEQYQSGYQLRYLHRFDLGIKYPAMIRSLVKMLGAPPLDGKATLVVDHTGVGRPIIDMLREADLSPIAVTITGGDAVTQDGNDYRVPKRDLVHALVKLFQSGELQIAAKLPLAPALTKELANFKMKISVSGHDTYEAWREHEHDDLVLAAALAAWWIGRGTDAGNFLAAMRAPLPTPAQSRYEQATKTPIDRALVGGVSR